jgi:hypothetical protein
VCVADLDTNFFISFLQQLFAMGLESLRESSMLRLFLVETLITTVVVVVLPVKAADDNPM